MALYDTSVLGVRIMCVCVCIPLIYHFWYAKSAPLVTEI